MKVSILAIILTLLFSGCDTPVYESRVIIEQDGAIYSAYPDEIDESNEDIEYLKSTLLYDSIYNFLIVIPIKTKYNLYSEFHKSGKGSPDKYFWVKKLDGKTGSSPDGAFITYKYTKDSDEMFYYNLYNQGGRGGLFDKNISDFSINYEYYEVDDYNYINDYQSNTIIIKAKEIKDILDNLGIAYE